MNRHYSEADLLETYYMQPGESMPVMMHLAGCEECAAKYERLERKLRESASCSTEKPETFWARQRLSIMRRVGAERREPRPFRYAAAAMLAFVLGGAVVYQTTVKPQAPVVITQTVESKAVPVAGEEITVPRDPWQSDELKDFHQVVEWESWVAETPQKKGDKSL